LRKAVPPKSRLAAVLASALLVAALAAAASFACQSPAPPAPPAPAAEAAAERWLDGAPDKGDAVRLAVFNPAVFNIRALAELRKRKILDLPGLVVVGVYHVNQADSFAESRRYVGDNRLDWFHFHAVSAEAAEPSLFEKNALRPDLELILKKTDGVIFFGGPDIPASVYGEKTSLLTEITDPFRHYLESSAVFQLLGGSQDGAYEPLLAARPDFAVLGICLGLQTLNIGTGGTLVQDVRWEIYGKTTVEDTIALGPEQWHANPYPALFPRDGLTSYNFHGLELDRGGVFVREMGFEPADHPRVLSSHHQAIGKMGRGLAAAAHSRDGRIVEAVEHTVFKSVLGVQFHPEHYALWDPAPRFGTKPGEDRTSCLAILEAAPPSLAFNKGIWAWFAAKLAASRAGRGK